jgi:hypothetical protein
MNTSFYYQIYNMLLEHFSHGTLQNAWEIMYGGTAILFTVDTLLVLAKVLAKYSDSPSAKEWNMKYLVELSCENGLFSHYSIWLYVLRFAALMFFFWMGWHYTGYAFFISMVAYDYAVDQAKKLKLSPEERKVWIDKINAEA